MCLVAKLLLVALRVTVAVKARVVVMVVVRAAAVTNIVIVVWKNLMLVDLL